MNKASWAGALMIPHQTSYESPPLFVILSAYFSENNTDRTNITKEEYEQFLSYSAAFF